MSIYKPCDIRGLVATELSPGLYEAWGCKLGRRLAPGDKFLIGGDVRESTPGFIEALAEGLCREGLDVVELGRLPTPMIYYAKRRLEAAGCAIVTASHNPATMNGLKWMIGERPPTPEEVAEMGHALESDGLSLGQGRGECGGSPHPNSLLKKGATAGLSSSACEKTPENTAGQASSGTHIFQNRLSQRPIPEARGERGGSPHPNPLPKGEGISRRKRTVPRRLDVSFDYVAQLQETFVDSLDARLHVVIDPMHGAWSAKARRYLHAIFPQCIFTTVHDEPDGAFGDRPPDCSRPENLQELCDAVYHQRAHLGVAFDGDGDRFALADDEGIVFSPEEAAFAMLELLDGRLSGETFVHDLKLSDRIIEAFREAGAATLAERSGHAFIRAKMCESKAIFGMEASGHLFFRELGGGEDPLHALGLVIAWMARTGRKLSDVRRDCPAAYITPDLRIAMDDAEQAETIERIVAAWPDFPQRRIDGVRIETPGGWALVRRSVTEPALTFRFEGLDWHALNDLVNRFCDKLPDELSDQLWSRYQSAVGGGVSDLSLG